MKNSKTSNARQLKDLDGVGPAALKDFELLGIRNITQLAKANPQKLYDQLCQKTGATHDICVLDVFACAVAQAKNPSLPKEQRQWFWWSRQRKRRAS